MRTFFALIVLLFGLFAAGWTWYTGDTRPFELAFWKQAIYGNELVDKSTAKAALSDIADAAKEATKVVKKVAKKAVEKSTEKKTAAPDPVKVAYKVVGSPSGRYVEAKAGAGSGNKEKTGSAPGKFTRVGSPVGRYVEAAAPADLTTIARVESPAGRYVDAPKVVKAEKPAENIKLARVSSPDGRYVSAPRIMAVKQVDTAKIPRFSSPTGRYVDAPAASPPKADTASSGSMTRIGSPAGRYVDEPTSSPRVGVITRVGPPEGRYVEAAAPDTPRRESKVPEGYTINTGAGWPEKAVAATTSEPKRSKSGALVFPITFEYRKSTFTSDGQKAADQLSDYIKAQNYSNVTLTGHTDSRGGEAVNLRISKNRLDAVAEYLRAGGYKGELDLQPKGKSQPFDGVDRSKYSEEDLWDLDRRVELVSGS